MTHAQQFSFFGCLGIICLLFWLWGYNSCPKCEDCTESIVRYVEYPSDSLTKETLEHEIKRFKIKFPEIVFSQVMFETGNLKCKDCSLDKNNLFGFQRDSTGYLTFDTWQLSIAKYKFWQDKHWDSAKYKNYYECIERCWGADSGYVGLLMKF